jgi:hypothetical protein
VKIAPVYRRNEEFVGVAVLYAAKASLGYALLGARTRPLVCLEPILTFKGIWEIKGLQYVRAC